MMATIPPGARILMVEGQRPRPGEIWAYVSDGGTLVAHRFLGRESDGLVFFGDANLEDDPAIADESLVGRVWAIDVGGRRRRIRRSTGLWRLARRPRTALRRLRRCRSCARTKVL